MKEFSDQDVERLLIGALEEKPVSTLPANFAAKVRSQLPRTKRRPKLALYGLCAAGVLGAIAGIYGLLTLIGGDNAGEFAGVLLQYKWIFVFIGATLLLIQYLDQEFVLGRRAR
jgi:hypothetical protein